MLQALLISEIISFLSITATLRPFSPAVLAAISPAGPAPTTIRSYSFAMFISFHHLTKNVLDHRPAPPRPPRNMKLVIYLYFSLHLREGKAKNRERISAMGRTKNPCSY
jgi:hypothetical protein